MIPDTKPSVVIAGAGLGGLCLAQKLVAAGHDVRIYERDATPQTRRQGYRITLDEQGIGALKKCLSQKLFDLALATASIPAGVGYFQFTNSRLQTIFKLKFLRQFDQSDLTTPRQFDRATLRSILLIGLEGRTYFGKQALSAESKEKCAILHFTDGTSVQASLVVGADGANSALRAGILPACEPVDTGSKGIYGRCRLSIDGASLVPQALEQSGVLAVDGPGRAFFFTTMRFGEAPSAAFARYGVGYSAPATGDYVMWALLFPQSALPADVDKLDALSLHQIALEAAHDYHPLVERFVALADKDYTVPVTLSAAQRPQAWPGSRVTLLGDAVHVMPPFESGGGNTTLRDAALLGDRLLEGLKFQMPIPKIVDAYQTEMSVYAFPLVKSSTARLRRMNMQNPLLRWIMLKAVPWLRSSIAGPLVIDEQT